MTATLETTKAKMQGFRNLPVGWHFSEGKPADEGALRVALYLLNHATEQGFDTTDAFPDIDGGVLLTVYEGPLYLEFLVSPSGSIAFVREDSGEEVESAEGLTAREACAKLAAARHTSG